MTAGKPANVSGVPQLIVENGTFPTITGRRIPVPPAIRTDTNRKATADVKKVDQWLVEQAKAEAASRNDEFNGLQFSQMKTGKLSQADKDLANQYLFGHEAPSIVFKPAEAAPAVPIQITIADFDTKGRLKAQATMPIQEAAQKIRARESMLQSLLNCLKGIKKS